VPVLKARGLESTARVSNRVRCKKEMPNQRSASIKDRERYEALRDEGMSKEKAARIANSPKHRTAVKGGRSARYEDWTKDDLYDKAKEVGIPGRSKMDKGELIDALRHH
jgi:hypothetical protein